MSIKRTVSLVLTLAMVFSLVSPGVTAYAEGLEDNSLLDGFMFVETVPPTCSTDGYDLYTNEEGAEIHTNVVPATGEHVWGEGVVTAPTCVADGFTTYTCTVCGETKTETGESATGEHVWGEGVVTAPTCVADGFTTYTCTICGETKTETGESATGEHVWGEGVVTAPTCVADGFTTYTCTVCGATTTEAGDAATGEHVWDEGVVTAPTCGEDGYTTYTCTVCGATKTETGEPATGEHVWDEGVCTVCGADDPDLVAPVLMARGFGGGGIVTAPRPVDTAQIIYVSGNDEYPDSIGGAEVFTDLATALTYAGRADYKDAENKGPFGTLDTTVTLLVNTSVNQALALNGDITLDLNGKSLTLGSAFGIDSGSLTIRGTGSISGTNAQIERLGVADGYYYENGTVKAGYRYNVVFATYNGDEKTPVAQIIPSGSRATDPGDPTRTGYTFDGWKDQDNHAWHFDTDTVTKDITLTAQWTPIVYQITYDLNGGMLSEGESNPATYTIEDSITLVNPTKGALRFVGWTGTELDGPTTSVTVADKTGVRAYTAVFAVAQVDDNYYETLQTAVDAANGKTVKLLCDVKLDSQVSVSSGAVTLDLAGFKVTSNQDDLIQIASGASLTVKDSSDHSTGSTGSITTTSSTALNNSGTLNLEGGAIKGSGWVVYNEGTFKMTDGSINAGDTDANKAVAVLTYGSDAKSDISGGSISVTGDNSAAVYANGGTVNISGTVEITLSGNECAGVQTEGNGTANVTGGSITASGDGQTACVLSMSGTVTVSGNAEITASNTTTGDASALLASGGTITVSGGTFNKAVPEEYCEEDYIPEAIIDPVTGETSYGVKPGSYVARVDGQGYETFAEAVTAAGGTKTIVLEANITAPYTMTAGQTLMVQKGTFSLTVTPPANYILNTSGEAEGVTTYTLTEAVASIGDDLYATLTAAFADAQSGDVVNVVAGTVEIPNTAVIPAGVTLKGDGKETTTLVIASTSGSGLTINNANVTIKDMTIDGSQITSGGYNTLVNVQADGCLIDNVIMTGGGQSTWNSSILVETLPATATFTVSNSTIRGAFRGVLRESCDGNIVITNCDITATYPFNINGGSEEPEKQGRVTVTGGALHGWTSYSNVDKVTFTNVNFSKAGYDSVAAYSDTDFVGCTFDGDLNLYNQKAGFTWNVDAKCTKNGVPVTAANFKELFSADPNVWNKSTANAAVAVVGDTTYYSNIASDDGTKPTDMTTAVTAAKAANYEGYTFYADPTAALQTVDPDAHRVGVANGDPAGTWRVVQGVQTIVLDKTSANLNVGETLELTPTVGPESANNKEVVWSSSDETVATVDKNDSKGVVTAKNIGTELTKTVKITATAADGSGVKAECTVTVVNSTAVARVGDKYFGSVADAVADEATVDGSTVEILQAGSYTLPNLPKNITIKGNVVGVVFSHTSDGNVASIPNGASFENVTFEFGNVNYHGFQHNGGLTFTNCTINGKLFSYGDEVYTGCTFNQTNDDYNMWVYGGNVTYTGCTFNNTVKGKFLNVYNESTQAHKLKVENCTFVNGGEVSKAAINIKESCGTTALNYDVEISGTNTIVGTFPANSESATTNVYGNGLFQVDDRFTNGTEPALDVSADTTVVTKATPDAEGDPVSVNKTYPIAVATVTVGETTTSYASLNAALQAAATAHADATVTLLNDIDLTGETWTPIGADGYSGAARVITIQGENKTITHLSRPLFGYTWSNTEIKFYDLTVKDSALTGLNCSGAGDTCNAAFIGCISASRGTVFRNCHVVNCTFSGSEYTGAFYGYAAGYSNQNNGPVFADITITNCSVEGCTISGVGSSGAIAGHATGDAWTQVNASGVTVTGSTISGEKAAKTGILFGTAGVGQSAYGQDGGVNFSVSESGNTLYVNGTQLTGDEVHEVGRIGSNGGTVTVTPGGTYSVNPILTSDPTTGTIAPTEDYEITENDQGVYSVTPMPAVARVNGVGYTTLQKAVNAAQTIGGEVTITMVADTTITDADAVGEYALTIQANKNVVLDLNGKTVSATTDSETTYALILNQGTLTIQDSSTEKTGKITVNPTNPWVYSAANPGGYASNLIRNEGTLIVNSGTLYNAGLGSAAYAIDNYSAGKVTVNGGTIDAAKASAIRMFYNNGGSVTVNDGQIGHYTDDDHYSYMGIQVMSGTNADVEINGGTVDGSYSVYSNGSGESSVTISDGEFSGYVGFASAGPDTISISGGTFHKWVGAWGNQTGFISGGTFVGDAPAKKYIAPNKAATLYDEVTKTYVIADAVAQVTHDGVTTGYLTLAQAIAAAQSDDTVTLLDNITLTATQDIEKNLTLDLNGHNITATGCRALNIKTGTVSITGEGTISAAAGGSFSKDSSVIRVGDGFSTTDTPKAKASLTIGEKVTVSSDFCYGVTVFGVNTDGMALTVDGTVSVSGENAAVSGNGTSNLSATTMTINGTVTATQDYAIYHPGKGTLTVNGTVSGKGGIEAKGGTVTINSGASVTATATTQSHSAYNNGASTSGYAIAAVNNPNYTGDPTVTINGGTISGKAVIVADFTAENNGTVTATVNTIPTDDGLAWAKQADNSYKLVEAAAKIDTTYYATLSDAISKAQSGDTITLLDDITLTATQEIEKNLTLDLNGHDITATGKRALFVKSGEVSIVDNSTGTTKGTITSTHTEGDGLVSGSSVIRVGDSGTDKAKLTIGAGVTVDAPFTYGVTVFGTNSDGVELVVNGKINAHGTEAAISGNGTSGNKGAVTVNASAVITSAVEAIYHPQGDKLTITGGTITGTTAVYVKSGEVSISGGTLTGNGTAAAYNPTGDDCNPTGDALVVDNCNYPGGAPTVTISSGTFESTNNKQIGYYVKQDSTAGAVTATGNTLTLPDGYTWTKVGDNYKISETVAKIGDKGFATLAEAVTAAQANDTIVLVKDITLTATQEIAKNLMLDLNGHNITANGKRALWVKSGEVSIVDSSTGTTKGTITTKHDEGDSLGSSSSVIRVGDSGTVQAKLTIGTGVTVDAPFTYGVTVFGKNTNGVELVVNGTINAHGTEAAISGNGSSGYKGAVTVNAGAVITSAVEAIYHPQGDKLTINGGEITGATAVYVKSGTVEITGGTLTGNGTATAYNPTGDDCNPTGDALVVDSCNYPGGAPKVTISSGTFTVTDTNAKQIGYYESIGSGSAVTSGTVKATSNTLSVTPGYTWEADDSSYKLAKAAFTVTVTSSGNGTINGSTVSPVSGGMTARFGEKVTVTAKPVNGYTFVGWYDKKGITGTQLSKSLTYDYPVRAEYNDLVAVFKPVEGGTFRLTVTGSRFTINGGTVQRQRFDDLYTANAGITLEFDGTNGETFLYWVNASGKILSTSAIYTFDLVMDTKVEAVTSDATAGTEALVAFVNSRTNGQVLSQRYYSNDEPIIFPAAPSSMGKTFTGWSMTEDQIHAAMSTQTRIVVYPEYDTGDAKYDVTINYVRQDGTLLQQEGLVNPTITEQKPIGQGQIVTAPNAIGDMVFMYWMDRVNGNKLSYETSYSVRPSTEHTTLYAVYGATAPTKVPTVMMSNMYAKDNAGRYAISFAATRSIPEGYSLEETGILYTLTSNCSALTKDVLETVLTLTKKPDYVRKSSFTSTLLNDTGTVNFNTDTADRGFIGRGYIVVKNNTTNDVITIYSNNAIYGSYSTLSTGSYSTVDMTPDA